MYSNNKKDYLIPKENEKETEFMLEKLYKKICREENKTSVNNPKKIALVSAVFKTLSQNVTGTNVRVTCKVNEPFRSMACVSVNGFNIFFKDPTLFAKCARLASNIDCYPKTDGSVQIDFTFHGITVTLE